MNILVCTCANTELTPANELQDLLDGLDAAEQNVEVIPDLCRRVAQGTLTLPATTDTPLAVIACRPRAVRALLAAAGYDPLPDAWNTYDLRHSPAGQILAKLDLTIRPPDTTNKLSPPAPDAEDWPPWFPVIDPNRCVNCGQCRDFCLFGVYNLDAKKQVRVTHPTSCKNNCPACARICPQAAIIFPKHQEAPIDGAPITDEAAEAKRIQLDVEELLGDDPYAALKKRRVKSKRQLVDRRKLARARQERRRHQQSPRKPSDP